MPQRSRAVLAVAGAVALAVLWPRLAPPLPQPPDSDLYEELAVARHLVRGDGFVNDVVYPLSLAFPFAAAVPQPLIHRQPGHVVLLGLPVWAAGGGARATLTAVYVLQVALLMLVAALGLRGAADRGAPAVGPAWLLLLVLSPALAMSAAWGRVEIPVALLLLVIWFRWRPDGNGAPAAPSWAAAAGDGLLAGLLTLFRLELLWLPLLWGWGLRRHRALAPALLALLVWGAVTAPWAVRTWRLTGEPFFTLQAHAEHLKQTPDHPGYAVYRGLEPETLRATLDREPLTVWRKARHGLRFYGENLGRWLPWGMWLAAAALLVEVRWRTRRKPAGGGGPDRLETRRRAGPLSLLLLTVALAILQYAAFSHTVRHLLPLLPVLSLEILLAGDLWLQRLRPAWRAPRRALLLTLAAAAAVLLTPPRLPGWRSALDEARALAPRLDAAVGAVADLPPGPLFTDTAALLWRTGRAGVWSPLDAAVETEIRRRVPAMTDAPSVLVRPPAAAVGPQDGPGGPGGS